MKVLLFVLVLALAGGAAYYFYFKDHPISWMRGPELATKGGTSSGPKKDFKDVCFRLQESMDHIPVNLRDARQMPGYALDTRSKVAPYLQLHSEYTTVTQVCDLIIEADQVFTDHQEKCGYIPVRADASPQERARLANGASPAIRESQQVIWNNQRIQTDSKVRQLLATLENRRL